MLLNLHVKNLALIEEVDVDFEKGLIVLTGETGAGKSLILGSVNIALGNKASKDMIRKGTDYSLVELTFSVSETCAKQLKKYDIYMEEDNIVTVTRKISEGRSISKINGETVNIKTLKNVMSLLIDIHGQHDHQSLLYTKNHLDILDKFAKDSILELKEQIKEEYSKYTKLIKKLEEFNEYIRFRKVAVIGLGVSNMPLLEYLYEKKAQVTVFDERTMDEIPSETINKINTYEFSYSFGKNCLEKLNGFNIIFRSPSCLPTRIELQKEAERGAIVTTEVEMLMEMCPCKIVGVTGSDGKTTTTSLINAILKKAGYKTFLGGNIGTPLFTKLPEMEPNDIVVLELSSFQLMNMHISPDIAVITNITPNHLNIHKDYQEYIDAKKCIFKNQNEKGILILNYDNDITRECAKEANGNVVFFSSKVKLDNGFIVDGNIIKECNDKVRKHILNTDEVILRGNHNFQNIATALAATKTLVDTDIAVQAIKEFKPVEHRIEFVKEIDGVKWYNDSASSSPTRTISGINAFKENIILIAGGYDKNLEYEPLAKPVVDKVSTLILIGQTAEKIYDVVKNESEKENKKVNIYMCDTLEQTIEIAKKSAKKGDVVLFSPASASFDMFKNFADRGHKFKDLVNKI